MRNINSVRAQGIPPSDLEHWIIDGGSTDQTIEILKREHDIKWISEPDNGLSDAVNKGIRRAKGEWIIWLNSDDELAPRSLEGFLRESRAHPDTRVFCGAQKVFGYTGELESVVLAWDYNLNDLLGRRTAINQASTFVHRQVYETVGLLDTDERFAMDYEWMVRAMHRFKCRPIDVVLTHYHRRPGSIMDAGIAGQHRAFLKLRREYGRSRWDLAELRWRFYVATEFLRRIAWLRRAVRALKRVFGRAPSHPVPPSA